MSCSRRCFSSTIASPAPSASSAGRTLLLLRLFIALPVPPDVARECARAGERFAVEAVKRVGAELMHLTLAFIGYVPDATAPHAARTLRESVAGRGAIACRLGEVGAFPTMTRPRVVWIGLAAGSDAIRDCALAVREGLRANDVPFDDKPPLAHLTVARVRDGIPTATRNSVAAAVQAARVEPIAFDIEAAVLYESRLARSGPTYIPLERVDLRSQVA